MNRIKFLEILISIVLISSCAPLKPVTVTTNKSIENYQYFYISPSYGDYSGKSVNPTDVVTGILAKEGFIRLPELKSELAKETLIVSYGESGRRNRGLGYTIEVTIQLVSAKSNELISSCSAEGQGDTEADDIRQAIARCLSALVSSGNN